VGLSVSCCSSGHHLPLVVDVEAYVLKAFGKSFRWRVWGKMNTYCLFSVFGILIEVGDYFSRGRISWLNSPTFLLLWYGFHLIYLGIRTLLWRGLLSSFRSHYYWWRPTWFSESLLPGSAFSAPLVSVSLSVVLRGLKNLRVNTALGGSSTTADFVTGLVDFLAAC
jgi:hypothetical protein